MNPNKITTSFESALGLNEVDQSLDYTHISPDCFILSEEQAEEAFIASQHIRDSQKRWAVYLGDLALKGFEQWLENQVTPDIVLNDTQAIILEPDHPDAITAVQNLYANGFRLCLIATPGQPDAIIDIPQIVTEKDLAHFYIVVIIHEELRQIQVREFLRGDSLQALRQKAPLTMNRDGTCAIPAEVFETDLDRLLLQLSCMQPAAITVLPSPQPQSAQPQATSPKHILQPVINLRRWFQQEIQDLVKDLTWTLIPSWQVASAMRGDTTAFRPANISMSGQDGAEGFFPIFKSLAQKGIHLSSGCRAAYQSIQIDQHSLQLCVLAALLPGSGNTPEWSLMAILKPQRNRLLPDGISLRISDLGTMLVEQGTQSNKASGSLFVRAIGEGSEELTITVSYANPEDGTSQVEQSIFTIGEA